MLIWFSTSAFSTPPRKGADWQEVVEVLFGLDPKHDPDRCRNVYDSHLARARWMTEHGYRDLLRQGGDGPNG